MSGGAGTDRSKIILDFLASGPKSYTQLKRKFVPRSKPKIMSKPKLLQNLLALEMKGSINRTIDVGRRPPRVTYSIRRMIDRFEMPEPLWAQVTWLNEATWTGVAAEGRSTP